MGNYTSRNCELQRYLKERFPGIKAEIQCFENISEVETKPLVDADEVHVYGHVVKKLPDKDCIRYCDVLDVFSNGGLKSCHAIVYLYVHKVKYFDYSMDNDAPQLTVGEWRLHCEVGLKHFFEESYCDSCRATKHPAHTCSHVLRCNFSEDSSNRNHDRTYVYCKDCTPSDEMMLSIFKFQNIISNIKLLKQKNT